jgi:acyl carrier protein phosphodiesterase
MNFLAHVYLSGNNIPLAIGNLIADRVNGKSFKNFSPEIQKGILLHRKIDHFTDHHPAFKACVTKLFPTYRHYSRVIVDMYFDHYLAAYWTQYHPQSLKEFSSQFYSDLSLEAEKLPENIQKFTAALIRYDWFKAYASVSGLHLILSQMEMRTQYPSKLGASTKELKENYTYFHTHFSHFMDNVIAYSKKEIKTL